jgi:uncharacterized membrane protein
MTDPDSINSGTASPATFQFNRPTIVALLYLASFVTGFTALVGVVLAYVWKGEAGAAWEVSHYRYHIRTFWIGMLGAVISAVLMIVIIGFFMALAVTVWMVVRTVKAMLLAQREAPVPNVESWLW